MPSRFWTLNVHITRAVQSTVPSRRLDFLVRASNCCTLKQSRAGLENEPSKEQAKLLGRVQPSEDLSQLKTQFSQLSPGLGITPRYTRGASIVPHSCCMQRTQTHAMHTTVLPSTSYIRNLHLRLKIQLDHRYSADLRPIYHIQRPTAT